MRPSSTHSGASRASKESSASRHRRQRWRFSSAPSRRGEWPPGRMRSACSPATASRTRARLRRRCLRSSRSPLTQAPWPAPSRSDRVRVRVAVPASVANLGPGFDILAMALQLQNDIRAEQRPGPLSVDAGPGAPAALNDPEHNLVTISYTKSCTELGIPATGVHFTCVNRIPIGRGMGSSAAAALAGVLVASALHQAPWDEDDVLERVAELEGHRDNAAAALLGGLAICAPGAPAAQLAVSDDLRAVLFIPDVPFTTTESRQVVPATFSRAD